MFGILAALGLTFIIKQGRIFKEVRSFLSKHCPILKDFFDCSMCIGFWAGLIIGYVIALTFIECILFALAISFISFIIQHILTIFEKIFDYHH